MDDRTTPAPGTADYYDRFPPDYRVGDCLTQKPNDEIVEHLRRRGLAVEPSRYNTAHFTITYIPGAPTRDFY